MASPGLYPDAELVVCAWILGIPGIQVDAVDHELPWDLNVPVNNGYVQVTVIGGVPNMDVPIFSSMVQVGSWVNAPTEDRIFRLQASSLAKQIQLACYDRVGAQRAVSPAELGPEGFSSEYPNAHVFRAKTLTEPHRMVSKDNPMYEGYSMDMMFDWTWGLKTN